jgi:hypothetical protein
MLTALMSSCSLWPYLHPRPRLHLLARRSILVSLHDLVAAHSQIPMRRRGGVSGGCHCYQRRTRLFGMHVAHVCGMEVAITHEAESWIGSGISAWSSVRFLPISPTAS